MSNHLFVTGGTGYLGREVVRQAARQGWQVSASYASQQPPAEGPLNWLALDVRNAQDVAGACNTLRPDVVIHTAFRQSDPDMWAVNATGAQHVAVAAQAVGARLIHISTDVIFNGETETPYTEADPPDPITPYGASKAEAERLVLEAHPKALLVRTSLIYGFTPVDRHTQFILDIAEGRSSARLFRDEYRCPVFVGDLAGALLELAANTCQGVSNVINVAGEESLSRHEFGQRLAAHYGHDPSRLPSGLSSETPGRRPRNCLLDIRPAQRILHTPLRGVTQVLAEQSNNP